MEEHDVVLYPQQTPKSVKVAARYGYFAVLTGLVDVALLSEINAGAWSLVYCMSSMTRRRNFLNIFYCCIHGNPFLPPTEVLLSSVLGAAFVLLTVFFTLNFLCILR
ncbi:hypothetical protein PoB_007012800 [Plakobranchus ocellatus]|uniref:CASP-like protein n=1 Tax=Plakobranchus ocellatus TaxID=259542 RepID=A0AAV4DH46_9GAST|nr:hypothetical protein PoB_007012800 [Plakobranchus ocellatus]